MRVKQCALNNARQKQWRIENDARKNKEGLPSRTALPLSGRGPVA
jgi:hypothetical protein